MIAYLSLTWLDDILQHRGNVQETESVFQLSSHCPGVFSDTSVSCQMTAPEYNKSRAVLADSTCCSVHFTANNMLKSFGDRSGEWSQCWIWICLYKLNHSNVPCNSPTTLQCTIITVILIIIGCET